MERSTPNCSRRIFALTASLFLFAAFAAAQGPSPQNDALIDPYFPFAATADAGLVSFDWDLDGVIHYTVGDMEWGLKLEVFKYDPSGDILAFQSADVWAGSRLSAIGDYIYFNDGGDFMRSDFNYYLYAPAAPSNAVPVLTAPYGASLWGLATRGANEFFASGSDATWGPAALFYSALDSAGMLASVPPVKIGVIGESPGPLAFDSLGNLFYAPGFDYSGTAAIYRWSAAEVAAALADPVAAPLSPVDRVWAQLPAPFDGATSLVADGFNTIYATATAWGSPSQLVAFNAHTAEPLVAAEYSGRLETLRLRNNAIYVSCMDGVFRMPLLQVDAAVEDTTVRVAPGETALFAVTTDGGLGDKDYQWYRLDGQKSPIPVGDNLAHYATTAHLADNNTVYYCLVSDFTSTVESPHFVLKVQAQMPASGTAALGLCVLLLAVLGGGYAARRRTSVQLRSPGLPAQSPVSGRAAWRS